MTISTRSRVLLATLSVVAVALYGLIVDLGVSAGRIHPGVSVSGIDVGGLTVLEAARKLAPLGKDLAETPLRFDASGVECTFVPRSLGWGPQAFDTATAALEIGRTGGVLSAIGERVRAWIGGITVDWAKDPDPGRLRAAVERCAGSAEERGANVDRAALSDEVAGAIGRWPPVEIYELPFER